MFGFLHKHKDNQKPRRPTPYVCVFGRIRTRNNEFRRLTFYPLNYEDMSSMKQRYIYFCFHQIFFQNITIIFHLYPQQDSNLHYKFRKLMPCPLDYGSITLLFSYTSTKHTIFLFYYNLNRFRGHSPLSQNIGLYMLQLVVSLI